MKSVLIAFFLIIITITLTSCNDDSPYPKGGRDTVAEFGDRRFVILSTNRHDDEGDDVKSLVLWDREKVIHHSIDIDIYNYKDINPFVYTVGKKGYTKLNYITGEYEQSMDIKTYNQEDKEILTKIENGKSLN